MNGRPSFRFRLERVRALRERSEDTAKHALATALAHHRRGEDELVVARERVANASAAQLDAAAVPTTATELAAYQAYLERAERAQHATSAELARREREVADRRQELSRASRDRQALERLKATQLAEHERESARQEALVLDEIAINGFRRRTA
jgi:flagellar FliJ protein